jgi:uncharacterized tellurite resistance protein B-like protein
MSHFFLNFLNSLFNQDSVHKSQHSLLKAIQNNLPNKSEQDTLLIYCIAGLLSRIAYNDLKITQEEVAQMETSLIEWGEISSIQAQSIVKLANEQMKLMAGIDNHKYCSPLIDLLDEQQRYSLLETLFKIAQSDGEVSASEDQEIRLIAKALGLPHRYFTAARAKINNN